MIEEYLGLFVIAFLWGLIVKVAMDLQYHYRHILTGPYV